jgi:predicted ATPase
MAESSRFGVITGHAGVHRSCVMVHLHKVSGAITAFLQRRVQAKGVTAMVITMGAPLYFSRGYGFRGLD